MSEKPPKLSFATIEPIQDYYDDGEGNQYSVARLIDDTKHLKPFDCPIASLDLSEKIWDEYDMFNIAFHVKKVMEADFKYPIILDWRGCVADGRHRVIKAIIEGRTTIKAVRITWTVKPCRTVPK